MWIGVGGFQCGLVLLGFGVDWCWFLWSLGGNVVGFGVARWWRFVILVWIGCGLAVVVCDFGLDRWWVGGGFWFGSARWVCFGLSKGFVGCDEWWPVVARSQSGRAYRHGYRFLKKIVDLGLVLLWVLVFDLGMFNV